jgi:acyl transferase domain-containing protein/thioesterase domain-containing protein/acyl carrier protein
MSNLESQMEKNGLEVAVIGMAGRFPGANNIDEFWRNLELGKEFITFLSDQELESAGIENDLLNNPAYVKSCGSILEDNEYFDAAFFGYTPGEAQIMDPQMRILHECVWTALENAGYNPDSYEGLIGFYAGASSNFNWNALAMISGKSSEIGAWAAFQCIDREFLCTRVSHRNNLKGPAVVVQSACSTSLLAIHLACQAILNGECDIAMAGGVSVVNYQPKGYVYQEGMILSPDGHCRAFDAKAQGTIPGSGVGIVVLKSLDEALEDRDYIHAVVKGTAVNNDGSKKVNYYAPARQGETRVIRAAFQAAEVEPESIGYVETHGTGTPLGDSIEIEALKQAFITRKRGFCAVGSVKSNIGHLDAAAGVTGFIKTVLALEHKRIPPNLHFQTPNPKIDFENSPFYVNTTLKEWQKDKYPLRAGVSAFGIGGTNAHVILEESPQEISPIAPSKSRQYQLMFLSAKTPSSLDKAVVNLLDFLKKNLTNPDLNLADAAYTLQVGRKFFENRCMLICSTLNEAVKLLTARNLSTGFCKDENRPVVFMFPGQGAHYVNMGLELYREEPVFREEMDRCFEILKPLIGFDIKEILYPRDSVSEVSRASSYDSTPLLCTVDSPIDRGTSCSRKRVEVSTINQTEIAQPLIFVFEYALAQLLMKWGIKPDAMIGHSIGEYTAACLSSVFSLEDALALLVLRGKLMQRMQPGIMLSALLPEKELKSLLEQSKLAELSVAAVNSPSHCVVSGHRHTVDALAEILREKGYETRYLHTSHAFHSQMMDPILDAFEKKVKEIELKIPKIPYISNVTGKWINADEVVDPGYWTKHLRYTVRFADGIEELLKKENSVFIEVGPGKTLSTFVRQYKNKTERIGISVIDLVRPPQGDTTDHYFLLNKIGQLWLQGVIIDWSEFYSDEKRHHLPLPTYPFEKKRFWFETNIFRMLDENLVNRSLPTRKNDAVECFFLSQWIRSELPVMSDSEILQSNEPLLVFPDESPLGRYLVERLKEYNDKLKVIVARSGKGFQVINEVEYTVNPYENNDYDKLFKQLIATGNIPTKIIHLWGATEDGKCNTTLEEMYRIQNSGLFSLVKIARAIEDNGISGKIQFEVVTSSLQEVAGDEKISPIKAAISGLVKSNFLQYPNISCRWLDIKVPVESRRDLENIITKLIREFSNIFQKQVVAYRGSYRWEQTFTSVKLNRIHQKFKRLEEAGVYLITGGLGDLGFALAESLAQIFKARLILVDSLNFPERKVWDEYLQSDDKDKELQAKILKIKEWENRGAKVYVHNADISDHQQMKGIIAQADECLGRTKGIIYAHTHTLTSGGDIETINVNNKTSEEIIGRFLNSNVKGPLILDEILKDHELDFVVFFSSESNNYNAHHEFFKAFSYQKQKQGSYAVTIACNDGIKPGPSERDKWKTAVFEVFNRIIANDFYWIMVSTFDLIKIMGLADYLVEVETEPNSMNDGENARILQRRPGLTTPYVPPANKIEQILANIWREFFGIEIIGVDDDFFDLGGDSLKASIVMFKISNILEVKFPLAEFLKKPTIKSLALLLEDKLGGKWQQNQVSKVSRREQEKKIKDQLESYIKGPVRLLNQLKTKKLFCFPSAIPIGLGYWYLSSIITDYSFFSFGFIEDVERLEKYADIITNLQKEGSYILLTYSAGGILTFEVARALQDRGFEVSSIILIDSFFTGNGTIAENREENSIPYEEIEKYLKNLGVDFLKDKVIEKTKKYAEYWKNPITLEVVNANVHLILSEENRETEKSRCWNKFTTKVPFIYQGFGDHSSMFNPVIIEKNAEIIRKILKNIESRSQDRVERIVRETRTLCRYT